MPLKIKRIYDPAEPSDGRRILVDRLWPRGIAKDKARIDEWLKELAPSDQLRKLFHHKPERWEEFEKRYRDELQSPEKQEQIKQLQALAKKRTVTLLFAARDTEHNNAVALANFIKRK
ncbi:MAG: DUF488 domain-containing protein [candidate division KSB1 bacterium]|nr:DUF488 domain-containing protein [candidate division KSB1 bacterium]MDZ7302657.1 DUF488 domain-containing protein [candidate division KSB1 bacterium]MDZ7311813.1 DUF488 domain-containing protein [candidate division KSB1 bacterium]